MYALNTTQLIGRLTEKPEVRTVGSAGTPVTDLNLEIRTHSTAPGTPISTTFFQVTLWRRLAEIARDYLDQGSEVYVSGRLETDSWEDDQGNKKYKTKLIANELIMLTPKTGGHSPLPESLQISGGLNRAEIIGNTTKDPELKTTTNGNQVCSFSVATNRSWKDQNGEMQEKTEFHNLVVWGDLALEVSKHITKGRKIYASGRVQTRSWEGPDGNKRYTTEIIADTIKSLGHSFSVQATKTEKPAQEITQESPQDIPSISYESDIKPEDLPF
jgi:single-strand DNA-binding protein